MKSPATWSQAEGLCQSCALCCNGVIFADVQLQAEDRLDPLAAAGLRLTGTSKPARLRQPCAALQGCTCRIYPDRPVYCRQFECLLLKRLRAGTITPTAARRLVQVTRKQVETVRELLRQMGERDEAAPLAVRVRRIRKRLETQAPDRAGAALYSRLTVTFHRLGLRLSRWFYSAPQ